MGCVCVLDVLLLLLYACRLHYSTLEVVYIRVVCYWSVVNECKCVLVCQSQLGEEGRLPEDRALNFAQFKLPALRLCENKIPFQADWEAPSPGLDSTLFWFFW